MRRSAATAALLLALCLGASTARELQGMAMDGKKDVAGAVVGAVGDVAGAAWDATKGVASATHAKISGIREAHEAKVSGMRASHAAKVSALRAHLYGDAAGMTPTATPAECLSVAEVAQKAGNFSVLLAAAQAAGLAGALSDRSLQATVFAPTDDAFALALAELDLTPADLLKQPALLQKILKYHVVPTPLTSAQLQDGRELPTLLSAELPAPARASLMKPKHGKAAKDEPQEDGKLGIDKAKVISLKPKAGQAPLAYQITVLASLSSAEVVVPDVQAGCPAVIHVIDHVLLPALGKAEDAEDEAAAGAGARKHSMLGWADLLDLA